MKSRRMGRAPSAALEDSAKTKGGASGASTGGRRNHPSAAAGFRLRPATPADLDVLVHQRHMMFEDMRHRTRAEHRVADESYRSWAPKMMKKSLLRCRVVANREGEVVAGGCVWLRDVQPGPGHSAERVPYLLSMYTEPEFRRLGLATMVVEEAMAWARRRGYRAMTLHASKKGRRVYGNLGWERTWEMKVEL